MLKSLRLAVVLGALGIGAFACTAGSGPIGLGTGTGAGGEPVKQAQVTSSSGVQITATISAVTLGEECAATAGGGTSSAPSTSDCAAPSTPPSTKLADGGTGSGFGAGGCGATPYCQGSNMQIAFTASAGSKSATVEVVSVTLLEAATGKVVDTLKASKPQSWSGNGYAAWDQTIPPASELKASYDLTSPAWSTLTSGADSSRAGAAYSTSYKLDVTLRIDGVEVTLESAAVNREPPVST